MTRKRYWNKLPAERFTCDLLKKRFLQCKFFDPVAVSPDHYASFLEKMGHTVRRIDGLYWFNTNRGVYTAFPFDQDIDARTVPLKQILGRDGLVARFGCPVEQGISSHRILCDNKEYDFPSLRSRTRTQVRRGLEDCKVERVEFAELREHAIQLNIDTLLRQGRRVPSNIETYWRRYYEAAAATTGAEAWAAWCDGRMAAYVIAFTINRTANMLIVRSALDLLPKFPNNALIFQYLHQKIREPQIDRIVYGYESIQAVLVHSISSKPAWDFSWLRLGNGLNWPTGLNRSSIASQPELLRSSCNGSEKVRPQLSSRESSTGTAISHLCPTPTWPPSSSLNKKPPDGMCDKSLFAPRKERPHNWPENCWAVAEGKCCSRSAGVPARVSEKAFE